MLTLSALVNVAVEVEADGLNGDTCDGFEAAWYEGSNTKGRALAVEAQSMGSERYTYLHMPLTQ